MNLFTPCSLCCSSVVWAVCRYEKAVVSQACNSSLCTLLEFQFSLWPDHVRDLKLQAYRSHFPGLGMGLTVPVLFCFEGLLYFLLLPREAIL